LIAVTARSRHHRAGDMASDSSDDDRPLARSNGHRESSPNLFVSSSCGNRLEGTRIASLFYSGSTCLASDTTLARKTCSTPRLSPIPTRFQIFLSVHC
jgi:hypothetical protein